MKFAKSTNPVINRLEKAKAFSEVSAEPMTLNGTINKTIILFAILLASGLFSWNLVGAGTSFGLLTGVGLIGGIIFALVTIFKPQVSPYTAPIYAVFEGLFVGSISAVYGNMFEGLVVKAIGITLAILFIMLVLYRTGTIKATPKFKKGIMVAIGGVMLFYFLNFIFGIFGGGVSFASLGLIGIGLQLVIIVIASLSLVLDFDNIEKGVKRGMPKYGEWYSAFGIMVTLVWLYLEILRLLSLLSGD